MAIEWTPEKVNACAALYGKVNWSISVGDRCVKHAELGNDPQDIELVNSVGGDSTEFMRGKVWLLTSDDVENVLRSMGYCMNINVNREADVGGIAHITTISVWRPGEGEQTVSDPDTHYAMLKALQRVVNNEQPRPRQEAIEERETTPETNEQSVEGNTEV